jgi:hypothetical protein
VRWISSNTIARDLPPKKPCDSTARQIMRSLRSKAATATVLGCVGVDENDDIWVLPDLVMDRMETDRTVDEMLMQFKTHKPLLWWMESELISKSFGPFLRKRMQEERDLYLDRRRARLERQADARALDPGPHENAQGALPAVRAVVAGSARADLAVPVRRPRRLCRLARAYRTWVLIKEVGAAAPKEDKKDDVPVGSIQWILRNAKARAKRDDARKRAQGW